jgi:hypothetical protein
MTAKPFLMGSEVEYSMPVRRDRARAYHTLMLDAIRGEHDWLRDIRAASGIYIDNGSRYYLDSGNHNEFSSPEVHEPRQIALYDRAHERILLHARDVLRGQGIDICITKHNINFTMPGRVSWGQHEAYTCWLPLELAAPQLTPHLVSRVPYAGAGYLSPHPQGMGFELSQRACHMTRALGSETTHSRAVFCTRAWKSSDVSEAGWTRTNLISKDSQRCSFGMYLTFGVTGLLFMIINEGHTLGKDVQVQDPVAAMRAFSLDPRLRTKVRLTSGKQVTAIDIQRAYLREAQPYVESGAYPAWTHEVLRDWAATLDQLEDDPFQLADKLDTYLKLRMFDHQVARARQTWTAVRQSLRILERMRQSAGDAVVSAVLSETDEGLKEEQLKHFKKLSKSRHVRRAGLDRLRFALRLQAVELNYHELGGLFDQLNASGRLNAELITSEEIEYAIHHPPRGGRAEARSKLIAAFQGQPWFCDWQYVVNQAEEKWVDLRDPFASRRDVSPLAERIPQRARPTGLEDFVVRIAD